MEWIEYSAGGLVAQPGCSSYRVRPSMRGSSVRVEIYDKDDFLGTCDTAEDAKAVCDEHAAASTRDRERDPGRPPTEKSGTGTDGPSRTPKPYGRQEPRSRNRRSLPTRTDNAATREGVDSRGEDHRTHDVPTSRPPTGVSTPAAAPPRPRPITPPDNRQDVPAPQSRHRPATPAGRACPSRTGETMTGLPWPLDRPPFNVLDCIALDNALGPRRGRCRICGRANDRAVCPTCSRWAYHLECRLLGLPHPLGAAAARLERRLLSMKMNPAPWPVGDFEKPEGVDIRVADRRHDDEHEAIRRRVSVPTTRYLSVPEDAITFTPPLSDVVYGDGKRLFGFTTIYNRPEFWLLRGDSSWRFYDEPRSGTDILQFIDLIGENLRREFGDGEPGEEDYEDWKPDDDLPEGQPYPAVDLRDGSDLWRCDDPPPGRPVR